MTGEVVGGGGRHTEEPGTPCPHQPGPPDTGASHEEGSSSLLDTQTSGCPPPPRTHRVWGQGWMVLRMPHSSLPPELRVPGLTRPV